MIRGSWRGHGTQRRLRRRPLTATPGVIQAEADKVIKITPASSRRPVLAMARSACRRTGHPWPRSEARTSTMVAVNGDLRSARWSAVQQVRVDGAGRGGRLGGLDA